MYYSLNVAKETQRNVARARLGNEKRGYHDERAKAALEEAGGSWRALSKGDQAWIGKTNVGRYLKQLAEARSEIEKAGGVRPLLSKKQGGSKDGYSKPGILAYLAKMAHEKANFAPIGVGDMITLLNEKHGIALSQKQRNQLSYSMDKVWRSSWTRIARGRYVPHDSEAHTKGD